MMHINLKALITAALIGLASHPAAAIAQDTDKETGTGTTDQAAAMANMFNPMAWMGMYGGAPMTGMPAYQGSNPFMPFMAPQNWVTPNTYMAFMNPQSWGAMMNPMSYMAFMNPAMYSQMMNPMSYMAFMNPATYGPALNPYVYMNGMMQMLNMSHSGEGVSEEFWGEWNKLMPGDSSETPDTK